MLPTFLIAGVPKSGSTSLYHYLRQHPDIFMPEKKEPNFFIEDGPIQTLSEYEALFADVTEPVRGEASVGYMNDPMSPERIATLLPEVQILIVLRDPAERAYSHYNMLVEHGVRHPGVYNNVLRRADEHGDYEFTGVPVSHYAAGLRAFQTAFGENVHVHLYEDYKADPVGTVRKIFAQIGADSSFVPDVERKYNRTHRPKSGLLQRLMRRSNPLKAAAKAILPTGLRSRMRGAIASANRTDVPPLDASTRKVLIDLLRSDIEETESLIGRDLSHWKT